MSAKLSFFWPHCKVSVQFFCGAVCAAASSGEGQMTQMRKHLQKIFFLLLYFYLSFFYFFFLLLLLRVRACAGVLLLKRLLYFRNALYISELCNCFVGAFCVKKDIKTNRKRFKNDAKNTTQTDSSIPDRIYDHNVWFSPSFLGEIPLHIEKYLLLLPTVNYTQV